MKIEQSEIIQAIIELELKTYANGKARLLPPTMRNRINLLEMFNAKYFAELMPFLFAVRQDVSLQDVAEVYETETDADAKKVQTVINNEALMIELARPGNELARNAFLENCISDWGDYEFNAGELLEIKTDTYTLHLLYENKLEDLAKTVQSFIQRIEIASDNFHEIKGDVKAKYIRYINEIQVSLNELPESLLIMKEARNMGDNYEKFLDLRIDEFMKLRKVVMIENSIK